MTSALEGVRILDFSRQMAAPYATALLSDFGADVVKVEALPRGDQSRATGTAFIDGESALFLMWNHGKRSIAVDLRGPAGLDVVRRLADRADVVVENYRPGTAEEIGIGYDELSARNPRLIYCSLSAFGSVGPLAQHPGTDPVVQAMSGVMSLTGEPDGRPMLVGVPIADFVGAMVTAQAVMLGLLARERTGAGQRVEVSMLAGLVYALTSRLASYWASGEEPGRDGSAHSMTAPFEVYRTADGDVVAGAWAPGAFERLCQALDREDLAEDPRFRSDADRLANRAQLNDILRPLMATRTTAEWTERFRAAQALFGEVNSVSETLAHPQVAGMLTTVRHATLGDIPQLGPPITMSGTPGSVTKAPPVLGQHTVEVLVEAGFSAAEVDRLVDQGVVVVGEGPATTSPPDEPSGPSPSTP